jgi:hypothetical protein
MSLYDPPNRDIVLVTLAVKDRKNAW